MSRFTALLDANVLVPVCSADTLLRLAAIGLYRPLWSDRILKEVKDALESVHPELADGRAEKRIRRMNQAFPDACTAGWESVVVSSTLPDPDDAHVIAAAVSGRADAIVTRNLKDFPSALLEPLGLAALHLDEFLLDQLDLNRQATVEALLAQAQATSRPPVTVDDILERLAGAPGFAAEVQTQLWRAHRWPQPRRGR